VLFVGRDPQIGELLAIGPRGRQQASLVQRCWACASTPPSAVGRPSALQTYDRGADPNRCGSWARRCDPAAPSRRGSSCPSEHRPSTTPPRGTGGPELVSALAAGTELTELSSELAALVGAPPVWRRSKP
jgi:hypothetical protein